MPRRVVTRTRTNSRAAGAMGLANRATCRSKALQSGQCSQRKTTKIGFFVLRACRVASSRSVSQRGGGSSVRGGGGSGGGGGGAGRGGGRTGREGQSREARRLSLGGRGRGWHHCSKPPPLRRSPCVRRSLACFWRARRSPPTRTTRRPPAT